MNYPKITQIIEIKKETADIKTITFKDSSEIRSGQFYMIWIPGIDEIPMSISYYDNNIKKISFRKIGEATDRLFDMKEGDKIGIRGPYGNGFEIYGKKILLVGAGTGISMIQPAIKEAKTKKIETEVIVAAKSKKELYFINEIKKLNVKYHISTDDGSEGFKGYATDLAKELLKKEKYDLILTCGPEIMMKKLMELSKKSDFQASLERYMKCGFGLCGQCCIGEGLRVCKEGPIFDKKTLNKIKDFGTFKRDASGKKINIT